MTLEEEVKFALAKFCEMKTMLCERDGGPSDLIPMLHIKYRHLKPYCGMLLEGNPSEMLPVAWGRVVQDGIPEFVMIMVEGYAGANRDARTHKKGEMEKDFKENPCSDVMEVITIQAVDIRTGNQITGIVSYKYDDTGRPEFGTPSVNPCDGEALLCNIPSMMAHCRNLTVQFGKVA